jgi:eukaryotic-like serine/threonine-protein kinase
MTPSSSIGHYRITSKLGEGGMGAVYRATDTKLNREVAVKVLPPGFAEDAGRMARFEREAQVLASLNHPNIAAIYGVENGAIVMELVDGSELKGPLPVETAIAYARQIATGLEAAHEKGVIHRDLKPANIKVTADGVVKLLDFGLAKATEESAPATGLGPTVSPTLSLEATRAGMILGTAAYMAPEQARGAVVDKRADVWAFGVVLMEMLTGTAPFRGETVSDTLADVLRAPVDWTTLPGDTPAGVRRLLARCLERDPKLRLRDIGEARIALSDPKTLEAAPAVAAATRAPRRWEIVAVAAVVLSVAGGVWMAARSGHPPADGVTRLSIALPPGQVLTGSAPAISRDGRHIAYVARGADSVARVYVRSLDRFDATEIPESHGGLEPFFSPDGNRIGFFARGKLMTAARTGGSPVAIADASYIPIGATWGENDTIYYAPGLMTGIVRVAASGGTPQKLTQPDDADEGYAHVWPQYIFSNHSVLYSVWGGKKMTAAGGRLLSPAKGTSVRLSQNWRSSRYTEAGYLLASGMRGVLAAPLDLSKPAEAGPATSVLEDVFSSVNVTNSWFAVSETGTLVYVPGDPSLSVMSWVDRNGAAAPIMDKAESMADPMLSPDGQRVALAEDYSIWVRDLRRGTRLRLTFENEGSNQMAVWRRDGEAVVFASNRDGDWELYSAPAAGGPAKRLMTRKGTQFPLAAAPDGTILFAERSREGPGSDLWTLSPDGKAAPLVVSAASKVAGEYSPDGRLLAYVSDESGAYQVYLRSIANAADVVTVSSAGGVEPKWSPDGKELFYRLGDAFFAVSVSTAGRIAVGDERKLFETPAAFGRYSNHAGYSVSPDGRRFLILRPDRRAIPTQINVVLNWFEELKAKTAAR